MEENTNVTKTEDRAGRVRYRCNGCGEVYSLHGVRAHQSGRYMTAACRPMLAHPATVQVQVSFLVTVDVKKWAAEYGVEEGGVVPDVRQHAESTVTAHFDSLGLLA